MFCPNCGNQYQGNPAFCERCGSAIGSASAVGTAVVGRAYAEPYRSTRGLALALTILFCIVILIDVVGVVSDLIQIDLLSTLLSGGYVSPEDAEASDNAQAAIGWLQLIAFIVTGIVFLFWIYGVHKNLTRLGSRNLQYSSGWAIGGFFIPFVNVVLPFLVVREIWKASDPERMDGRSWKDTSLSPIVPAWWILYIASGITGFLVANVALSTGEDVANYLNQAWAFLISDVLDIPAAILAILVVRGIVSRQDRKHTNLVGPIPVLS